MKVALDEHIPPALIRALEALAPDKHIDHCQICKARDYSPGPGAKTDVPWIKNFASDGGEVVISGDKKMRSVAEVHAAIAETGVKVYYLPTKWNKWDMPKRTGFILNWWSRIVRHAATVQPGECWVIPHSWDGGEFRRVNGKPEEN